MTLFLIALGLAPKPLKIWSDDKKDKGDQASKRVAITTEKKQLDLWT
jgi:hypothetical protein